MSALKIRVFTNPDGLKRISNTHLIDLLAPHRDYFRARSVEIPTDPEREFPHENLAKALMTYDSSMPIELMNGLYLIDETASNETLDDLLERSAQEKIHITTTGKSTPADIAVQIWLAKPDLLEERHVKAIAFKKTAFLYFPGKRGNVLTLPTISQAHLDQMAKLMDPWFESKQRGRGTHVFAYPRPDENKIWLLVRHGMPMTREGKHEDNGDSGVAFYRPQRHDVMIYDVDNDILAINAQNKGEIEIYRETLGDVVFADRRYFHEGNIFTLIPILQAGPSALECEDIEGVNRVRLSEVVRSIPGEVPRIDIQRSSDIFRALGENWKNFLGRGRITSAKFRFLFEGSNHERSVNVRPDSARYDRDSDAKQIEEWLLARGFYDVEREMDVIDDDSIMDRA